MWKVRELADKVTNVVMNYTEIESKVREATNDDAWGPTGTIKHELSQATYSYDQFPEVMGMLWKRIAENKRSPRRIYKSLLLLHHLLLHGSDRVVRAAQDRLYEIRSLQDYHVVYEPGFNLDAIIPPSGTETKDGELNVRVKAKDLVELIQDDDRLREERKKARKNRDKYVGIGSDRMMTSKWNDNDYGPSYGDDDFGRKSRSPSPPFRSKSKPYSDTEPEFPKTTHANSFNNNYSPSKSKPAPPSPAFEISDDFDPRADEKPTNDFGDFSAASSKSASTNQEIPTGDFADFQSAFGDSSSNINVKSETNSKEEDLFAMNLDGGLPDVTQTNQNNSSLLTDNLFNPSPAIPQNIMNNASFPGFGPSPAGLVQQGPLSPGFSAPVMSSGPQMPVMNSGGNDLLSPVLEPSKPETNSSSTPANDNNNSTKPSLKGTTWSDLNISIDDLNLGPKSKKPTAAKVPMNQMKTNATSPTGNPPQSSFGGLI